LGASEDLGERLWLGLASASGPGLTGEETDAGVDAGAGADGNTDAGGGAVSSRTLLAEAPESSSLFSGDRFTGLKVKQD